MDLKSKLIKILSRKISITKRKLLKQYQKYVICGYTLAFAEWWSIFWVVLGGDGYILAGGGWWWVVMDSGEWWWMVVFGGG